MDAGASGSGLAQLMPEHGGSLVAHGSHCRRVGVDTVDQQAADGIVDQLLVDLAGDFLGEGCTVSNPQGGFGQCSGTDDPGDPVSIVPGYGIDAEVDDLIEFGDLVTFRPTHGSGFPSIIDVGLRGSWRRHSAA